MVPLATALFQSEINVLRNQFFKKTTNNLLFTEFALTFSRLRSCRLDSNTQKSDDKNSEILFSKDVLSSPSVAKYKALLLKFEGGVRVGVFGPSLMPNTILLASYNVDVYLTL